METKMVGRPSGDRTLDFLIKSYTVYPGVFSTHYFKPISYDTCDLLICEGRTYEGHGGDS